MFKPRQVAECRGDLLHLTLDGADQEKFGLPRMTGNYNMPLVLDFSVYGGYIYGASGRDAIKVVFLVMPHVKKSTNLNLTLLDKMIAIAAQSGPLPPSLYTLLDGAGDNWSSLMFAHHENYCRAGVFKDAVVGRCVVSATHGAHDGIFADIGEKFGDCTALTIEAAEKVIKGAFA